MDPSFSSTKSNQTLIYNLLENTEEHEQQETNDQEHHEDLK